MPRGSLLGLALAASLMHLPLAPAAAGELVAVPVESAGAMQHEGFDGVVEAVRQTAVAAQVPGAILAVEVKAGDAVKAGQVLVRIDARAVDQNAAASEAQVLVARSALDIAAKELERQRQLFERQYISRAALERAEAQFSASAAQVAAQLAQANAARTQSAFHLVKAPYAGIVAEVPVALGDMAMPGRLLLTLYDPTALRITAAVPQSAIARLVVDQPIKIDAPGLPAAARQVTPARLQVLPTIDAATHTAQVRVDLPSSVKGVTPGVFARVWLPLQGGETSRLFVPDGAIVRRAEMTGVYVIDANGRPVLRQVRLGRADNGRVEVLSGVAPGERVARDPQAAARQP